MIVRAFSFTVPVACGDNGDPKEYTEGVAPHIHQLKKSNHLQNEKRADFSKLLTVEKENFHFGVQFNVW